MKLQVLAVLSLTLMCSVSSATFNTVGNGGDMLICPAGSPYNGVILDFYQAKEDFGLTIDLGPSVLTWQSKVNYVLHRLAQVSPKRAVQYSQWFADFVASEAEFRDGITLVDIPDTGAVSLPAGCEIHQIAVQRNQEDLQIYPKRYTIDNNLWTNNLDDDQRAILVLHELAYREALSSPVHNSIFVRYLNAHVISPSILTVSQEELMTRAKRSYYEIGDTKVDVQYNLDNSALPISGIFAPSALIDMSMFNIAPLNGRRCTDVHALYPSEGMVRYRVTGCTGESWKIEGNASVTFFRVDSHETRDVQASLDLDPSQETWLNTVNGQPIFKSGVLTADLVLDGMACMDRNKPTRSFFNNADADADSPMLKLDCFLRVPPPGN